MQRANLFKVETNKTQIETGKYGKIIFPKEIEGEMISLYLGGVSLKQIAKEYPCSWGKIGRILRENKIKIRKKYKKNDFDDSNFEIIDTPEKAYWLEFIFGDGNIYKNRLRITLRGYRKINYAICNVCGVIV